LRAPPARSPARPDAGHQQLNRCVRDDLRVDEYEVRVAREEPVLLELSVLGVDHRQSAARCVGRSDGRAVRPADPGEEARCLHRVDHAPAADGDGDVGSGLLDHIDEPVDLARAGDAAEDLTLHRQAGALQRRLDVVPDQAPHEVVGDDERARPDRLEVLAELMDRSFALHVPARTDDGAERRCHGSSSLRSQDRP
jgi:hypothetical protein